MINAALVVLLLLAVLAISLACLVMCEWRRDAKAAAGYWRSP